MLKDHEDRPVRRMTWHWRNGTHIAEHRKANKQGVFVDWHQVGVALEIELQMPNQRRSGQLEYRVIGINPGGKSVSSNTAAVVL